MYFTRKLVCLKFTRLCNQGRKAFISICRVLDMFYYESLDKLSLQDSYFSSWDLVKPKLKLSHDFGFFNKIALNNFLTT